MHVPQRLSLSRIIPSLLSLLIFKPGVRLNRWPDGDKVGYARFILKRGSRANTQISILRRPMSQLDIAIL